MYLRPRAWAAATISRERRLAVAGGGVHVQVAVQVVELDQLGQLACRGPFKLLAGLADLRREAGQVQRRVDVGFLACRRCTRLRPPCRLVCLPTRNTPYSLIFSPRSLAMPRRIDVVLLRAGEVLQRRAERLASAPRAGRSAARWPGGSTSSCRRGRSPRPRRSNLPKWSITASASFASTSRSRSPTVSRPRR